MFNYVFNADTSLQLDGLADCQMNFSIPPMVNDMKTFVYKVTTGVFVGVTVLLFILIISLSTLCQRKCK